MTLVTGRRLACAAVLVFLSFRFFPGIDRVSFYPDESFWTARSARLEEFLSGDFSRADWNPSLARYLIGVFRRAAGVTAAELNHEWDYDLSYVDNRARRNVPPPAVLHPARLGMTALAVLSGLFLFLLTWAAGGPAAALLAALFFGFSPYFSVHLRRAMSESALLVFTLLSAWLSVRAARRAWTGGEKESAAGWFALAGGAAGLAAASKLNGLAMVAAVALLAVIAVPWRPGRAKSAATAAVAGLGVFYFLSPYLYLQPLRGLGLMFTNRIFAMQYQAAHSLASGRFHGVADRVTYLTHHVLGDWQPVWFPGSYGLLLCLAVIGVLALTKTALTRWHPRAPAAKTVLLTAAVMGAPQFLCPRTVERYALFQVLFAAVFASVGLTAALRFALGGGTGEAPARDPAEPPTILILCGNAAFNRGDRFNVYSEISLIRARFPAARVVYPSYRPEVDHTWYPCEVVKRPLLFSPGFLRLLRAADVIVWGGGAMIADNGGFFLVPYWAVLMFLMKRVFRRPVLAWSHGLVVETAPGAVIGRFALEMADTVTVRDRQSLETLHRIGVKRDAGIAIDSAIHIDTVVPPDPADAVAAAGLKPLSNRLFALTPTYWPFIHHHSDILPYLVACRLGLRRHRNADRIRVFNERLARLSAGMVDRYGADVVLIPNFPSRPWQDVAHLREVARLADRPGRVHVLDRDDLTPDTVLKLWRRFDFLLSSSLHSAIVGTSTLRPCLHLWYEAKGKDFMTMIGGEDRLIPVTHMETPAGLDDILAETDRVLRDWPKTEAALKPRLAELQKSAERNLDLLAKLLPTGA